MGCLQIMFSQANVAVEVDADIKPVAKGKQSSQQSSGQKRRKQQDEANGNEEDEEEEEAEEDDDFEEPVRGKKQSKRASQPAKVRTAAQCLVFVATCLPSCCLLFDGQQAQRGAAGLCWFVSAHAVYALQEEGHFQLQRSACGTNTSAHWLSCLFNFCSYRLARVVHAHKAD